MANRLARIVPIVAVFAAAVVVSAADPEPPLRDRIDALVESAAVGPIAEASSDADFVRRIHLDLAGVVPDATAVREFLADPAADRRGRLVDRLLAGPGFARHLALTLDAALLERQSLPADLAGPWRDYLALSISADKPLDQLFREIIGGDGGDESLRPALAFFLVREAEPVQMTRAVGRMLFGRDLQCVQCHDHPLDDDLRQAEFHGLHAFLMRTSIFKADGKPPALLAEKADGEGEFVSVFTKEGTKGVWPALPGGGTFVAEPRPEPGDDYLTPPAPNVRAVPRHSRRAALAAALADSESFRRTLANRLWSIFFGRGLVHPLDAMGPGNPATHPRILDLLADTLRDGGFRLRPLVREIVLSRSYQRSVEPPDLAAVDQQAITGMIARLEAERPSLAARLTDLESRAAAAAARAEAAFAAERAGLTASAPLLAARDAARKEADAAAAGLREAEADLSRKRTQSESLTAAAAQAAAAAAVLPDDAEVAALATQLAARATERAAVIEGATTVVTMKSQARDAAATTLSTAREAAGGVLARRDPALVAVVEREAASAIRATDDCRQEIASLESRLALARDVAAWPAAAAADPVAAARLRDRIVDRWTVLGQVAPLRPLSPEQFALSILQVTGSLASRRAAAAAAVEKEPPATVAGAAEADRPRIRDLAIDLRVLADAAGPLAAFAALYGTPAGDFQASVNQALFFGNAPDVAATLAPDPGLLVGRLAALPDDAQVADEAILAVLARPARDEERADLQAFLGGRTADRPQAIAECVWALLSSTEFRFNH